MTKSEMKLAMLDQIVNFLDAMTKVLCKGCEKGDPLNMNDDHNFDCHAYRCEGKEFRKLAQYIRAGVMLKIRRD